MQEKVKMKHVMRLHAKPFSMIERGLKTIELRLYDEKRKEIRIGDEIEFISVTDQKQRLTCVVTNLYIFDSRAIQPYI